MIIKKQFLNATTRYVIVENNVMVQSSIIQHQQEVLRLQVTPLSVV